MRIIAEHLGFGVSTISRALTKQCRHHSSEVGMKLRSKASGIEAETAQLAERLPCPMAPRPSRREALADPSRGWATPSRSAHPYTAAVSEAELAELVRLYWDGLWGQRRLELIDQLMAEPYTRHSAAGTRRMRRADLKGEFMQYWRVLYDAVTTVDDQVIAGDRVWTRATMRGVNLEAGGTANVVTWLIVHRVLDGRFVESWSATLPGVDWTSPTGGLSPGHAAWSGPSGGG
jgi:hypothetical protein